MPGDGEMFESDLMTSTTPRSVLETVLDWSQSRSLWQRDALRRIVCNGALSDEDIAEIVALCKKDHGDPEISIVASPLEAQHLPAGPTSGSPVRLVSISNVSGVNKLAAGQSLPFEANGLTIVYGDNGAGKSGYSRILKRACSARSRGKIIADVGDLTAPRVAKATFEYKIGDATQPPLDWTDGENAQETLSAINVFDRDSGVVQVRNKNEVTFRPLGLDIPEDLSSACVRVKALLSAEKEKTERERDVVFVSPGWKPGTKAGKLLSALNARSDIKALDALANVSSEERARHEQLCADLARDPVKAAAEQELYASQLGSMASALKSVEENASDEVLSKLKSASDDARSKRRAAALAADQNFKATTLPGVGGDIWRAMWDATKRYAEHHAYPGKAYPDGHGDQRCVLCQQELDDEARTRLSEFDAFVRADTEREAQAAEMLFTTLMNRHEQVRAKSGPTRDIRRKLAITHPDLSRAALRFLASARRRQAICKNNCAKDSSEVLPQFSDNPCEHVLRLEVEVRSYAESLRRATGREGRAKLEAERDELVDRILLSNIRDKVVTEIGRLQKLSILTKCIDDTGTTQITKMGNDIADAVITPRMRDRFHSEIVRLAADRVRVEVDRSGGKLGSPQYQVRLIANPSAQVGDVLSEGEQTCVALAGFLTELATATHQSALVFDDPVSSLDHSWRGKVAERLVDELQDRQVIVFTHDMIFLNDLKDKAETKGRNVQLLTLAHTPAGAGTVTPGLPWWGASVADRVDKMEKEARDARDQHNQRDDAAYAVSVHRIYSILRGTWERAIEDVAFAGVINRHRDYVNTKNLRRATVLTESDCDAFEAGWGKCCDLTDSHDPSRNRNAAPPTPDEMLRDIQAVRTWVDAIRARWKSI